LKRIHLFEFEDFYWFPDWLRICLTRMMIVMHKLLKTPDQLAPLVERGLKYSKSHSIIDLCSGSGGPLPEVVNILKGKRGIDDVKLIMTDLYPNLKYAEKLNAIGNSDVTYEINPVDAKNVDMSIEGLRTMVGSLHHMKPEAARAILKNAMESLQPFLAFEISDNSYPKWIWWIAIPINIISSFFVSALARPFTFQQFLFTYLIPIIPITFAWDGAVSNARTYTLGDLDILLEGLESEEYSWEKGILEGKSKKVYLLGLPKSKHPHLLK